MSIWPDPPGSCAIDRPGTRLLKPPNRFIILAAAAVCGMGSGAIYMWSIFNKPLMEMFGYTPSEVSLTYSLFLLFTCFAGFLGGWLQKRFQARFILLGAGLAFGSGWLLTGFANSLSGLYLCFGALAGGGSGLLYNVVISVVAKWFPDKRGLANGICIGAMGLSSAVFAPIGNLLIEQLDVLLAFRIVGVFWMIVYLVLSWLMVTPPAGWRPAGWTLDEDAVVAQTAGDYSTRETIRQPLYFVLVALLAVASAPGYMATGHASGIAQQLVGLDAAQAALMVSLLAVGNFLGRLGFGALSDRIGRWNALAIALALSAADLLFFLGGARDFASLIFALGLVGACFGAVFTLIPALVADCFGNANFGQNYAFVFPGATIACFIGPSMAASTLETAGTYDAAFLFAGILSLAAVALVLVGKHLAKRFLQAGDVGE